MPPIARRILAVLAGLATAVACIMGIQAISASLYPPPPGMDYNDPEAVRAFMASLPVPALLLVLLSYLAGSLAGGFVAARLAPSRPEQSAGILAGILTILSLMNLTSLPHPVWFWVANLLIVATVPLLGGRLGERHAETGSGEV